MKQNTQKVTKAFNDAIVSELAAAGIKPSGTVSYSNETPEYTVETRAGPYVFHPWPILGSYYMMGIAGRFTDPIKARKVVDCNSHNGKWNFHEGYIATVEEAKQRATSIVTRILSLIDL